MTDPTRDNQYVNKKLDLQEVGGSSFVEVCVRECLNFCNQPQPKIIKSIKILIHFVFISKLLTSFVRCLGIHMNS